MVDQPAQRIADGAAVVSAAAAGASWTLADINYVVSIGAGGVAIIAGLCAIAWHVLRIRRELRERR